MRHFKPWELVDKSTHETMGDACLTLFEPDALIALDDLRDFFGVPLTCNNWHSGGPFEWRGARTPDKCIELGAPHSAHMADPLRGILCTAFDCDVEGMTAGDARRLIVLAKDTHLVKLIQRIEGGVSWLHFDLMPPPKGETRIYTFFK
jgi:hypothetical protein